jgi:AraC-like DNA-binding protein
MDPRLPNEAIGATLESTVSVRVVRGLIETVEHAGLSSSALLRAAQFDPAVFDSADARLPRAVVYRLCELAIELTGDPALGLHWAERLGEGAFVPVSHLIAHSANLRQGFESLAQFHRLLSDHASYQLVEREHNVIVRMLRMAGESQRIQRLTAEMMVAGFFRLIRQFDMHARPEIVSFEYAAPAYQREYERVFGGSVLFQQPFTGIVFARALLDAPAPHQDDDVHQALQVLAERRLLHITQSTPYALRVRELLVRGKGPHRMDMKAVAQALGLSVRSLRRRLADEGKAYDDIGNEALVIVAKHLLRDKQRSIQETAFEMGFSDVSAFHRAFKRWTGTTPSTFRDTASDDGPSK